MKIAVKVAGKAGGNKRFQSFNSSRFVEGVALLSGTPEEDAKTRKQKKVTNVCTLEHKKSRGFRIDVLSMWNWGKSIWLQIWRQVFVSVYTAKNAQPVLA